MSEPIHLVKANPLSPAENFVLLRRLGIQYLEQLGSTRWTDYNTHDPGITILEAVCYAITDLGYRTSFDMKDLLAPQQPSDDTWKYIFYTARRILHNNPLTINDYRKLLIDIDGIRNAWIEPSKDYEVPIYVDYTYQQKDDKGNPINHTCSGSPCLGKLSILAQFSSEAHQRLQAAIDDLRKLIDEINLKLADPNTTEAEKKKLLKKRDTLTKNLQKLELDLAALPAVGPSPTKIVELNGLYNVMIEYEEDTQPKDCRDEGEAKKRRETIRKKALNRLHHHRNLCEDFLSVNAVDYEDFTLSAALVLAEEADPDEVLAQLYFTVYKYFTPSVPFYTIEQMQSKGWQVDEIFEGPPLKHGFIDTEELEKTEFYRDMRLSDIVNAVMDIPGVRAITYLHIPIEAQATPDSIRYFNQWINELRQQRKVARLNSKDSMVNFCKERAFIPYNLRIKDNKPDPTGTPLPNNRNPARAWKLFNDLKSLERAYKLQGVALDFPVPTGEWMNLEDYYPVQYSLPQCYGVGEQDNLPPDATPLRRVQKRQLQGYLLFFEQILADYLSQLAHLPELFSWNESVEHTYYSKLLKEIHDLEYLLIDYDKSNNPKQFLTDFSRLLQSLVERPKQFARRRNHFLDHLMARFSENMDEYAELMKAIEKKEVDNKLIGDKIRLLADYPGISSYRGKAFDYTADEVWDTNNISGAERRIARLLGFSQVERRTLAPGFLVKKPLPEKNAKGELLAIIQLLDNSSSEEPPPLLTSRPVRDTCCAEQLMDLLMVQAENRRYYRMHDIINRKNRKSEEQEGTFWFELLDTDGETVLATGEKYSTPKAREKAMDQIQAQMWEINQNDGLHLIEHILLRPKLDEVLPYYDSPTDSTVVPPIPVQLLDICLDPCDLDKGKGENTGSPAYRFRISRLPADKCMNEEKWVLTLVKIADGKPFFQTLTFKRYEQLSQRVADLREYGSELDDYGYTVDEETKKFRLILHDDRGNILAVGTELFETKEAALVEVIQLIAFLAFQLDWYCAENPCDHNEDPYSFRVTVVLPCWTKRFRDRTFRNLVEKTIQLETPAHVQPRIYWIGIEQMRRFEEAYHAWLGEISQHYVPEYPPVNQLVTVLNTLKECGDCEENCKE